MRKNATKLAAAVLSLAMVMTSVNMPASAAKTKVKLNKTKATLYVNGSASEKATTLKVTVNGKKVNATFKSSNTKVLTVAKKTGKVTAKKNGTAKVTATYKKKKYNCTVTVKTYATSVSITSAKTLNLAAGKTATINATVKPSTASNKKVSFASSDKNVATVTSAGKVTAKKAGTATVTVKALGSKKAAKKATVKVNVKAAAKPTTEPTTTPTTAPTATPETPVATEGAITVTTNVSGATITVTSGGALVFQKQMQGNKITTPSFPNNDYKVKLTLEGYDDAEDTVTVKGDVTKDIQMKEKTGATAGVSNSIKGYKNTVLVNDKAILTVRMTDKDGKPVANKPAVLTLGNAKYTGGNDPKTTIFGLNVMNTDANGYATFVVGNDYTKADKTSQKATDTDYVGSVEYTATVIGDENATSKGSISFAAIDIKSPTVNKVISKLDSGTSANGAGYSNSTSVTGTANLSGKDTEYVLTQQVSSKGTDHSVTFNVKPELKLPATSQEGKVEKHTQAVNYTSPKYHTYAADTKVVNLDYDTTGLRYATLNFDKIQLSPYTKMTVKFYSAKDAATGYIAGKDEVITADDVEGMNKTNRGVQIPLTASGVKSAKIIIESAGQVETDLNDGYVLKDIVYVYDENKAVGSSNVDLPGASIKWNAVAPKLSQPQKLDRSVATDAKGLGINTQYTDSTFSYEVPVFPYTGDAVITEKDKNGKIVAYYLAPTENTPKVTKGTDGKITRIYVIRNGVEMSVTTMQSGDKIVYTNTNDIKYDSYNTTTGFNYKKAYKATAEEVTNYITTGVTTSDDGKTVKVDSEKNGSTTLQGVLSVEGIDQNLLNVTNTELYTSVQWNPIPQQQVSNSDAFLALAGQKIELEGQLVDKNGNAVSLSGKSITFKKDDVKIASNDKVTVVKEPATTDTNGKSTIVLSAAQATNYTNVTATCDDSNYSVRLSAKGVTVNSSKADLYWVNADLQYLANVGETEDRTTANKNTTSNNTIDVTVKNPTVGTPWEYGVKTVAGKIANNTTGIDNGKLAGYTISIDGLKIFTETAEGNKGKYTPVKDLEGKVDATSEYANNDRVSAKINGESVTDKVTFTATKDGNTLANIPCVGEGTPNMNAKINMNVKWQPKGVSMGIIAPQGTSIKTTSGTGTVKLYVRLTDSTGKNPLTSTDVTFKSGNASDKLASSQTDLATGNGNNSCKVTTNKYGVAEVYVQSRNISADLQSSIITATVDSIEQTASTTINWLYNDKTPALGVVKASKSDDKQVKVTFNNEINAGTVKPNNFKIKGLDAANKPVEYEITAAEVNGKTVTLTLKDTLPAGNYTAEVNNDYFDNGITYSPADIAGQNIAAAGQNSVAFASKNATYSLELNADGNGFEITHVDTPTPVLKDGTTITVGDNEQTSDFTITVNDKIVDQSSAFVTYDKTNKKFAFTLANVGGQLKVGTTFKVFYMGNEEGYTVTEDGIIGLAMEDIKKTNNTSGISANAALAAGAGSFLADNTYTCTVKVVADDGDKSLYTTANAKDTTPAGIENLNKIIASTSTNRLTGVDLASTSDKLTATDFKDLTNGQFVKLEFIFSSGTGKDTKTIATKTMNLKYNGTNLVLE